VETPDESSTIRGPQPSEDPEEQGLRILAKIIARKLARSRRDKYANACEEDEHNLPASGDGV
jgi:hypothetical protein